jgi:hypothetical protein
MSEYIVNLLNWRSRGGGRDNQERFTSTAADREATLSNPERRDLVDEVGQNSLKGIPFAPFAHR